MVQTVFLEDGAVIIPPKRTPPETWWDHDDGPLGALFHTPNKETNMDALAIAVMGGLARAVLAGVGGYLVKKGIDDGGLIQTMTGAVPLAVAGAWSWMSKLWAHTAEKKAAATGVVAK